MTQIMQGFPVPPEARVPRQDWDRPPWNRWSFQNVRQILPTAEVWRGTSEVWELPRNPVALDNVELVPTSAEYPSSTINDWLAESYTDGFMVLHRGEIVFERYLNGMSERSLHLAQSISKSIVGSVAGSLIGSGLLDPGKQVTDYLPELAHTGWQGATLQQIMDMTTGVKYNEDYEGLDSDIALTDIASGWKPPHPGVAAPACIWDQILTLTETTRLHGALFEYRSIESDVMAHCMERVTSTRLPDLISRELWQPLGCEQSACFTVDPTGYALADGGFNATLRDYARFGQMLLQAGLVNGRQIVPSEWIEGIPNGDPNVFGEPYTQAAPNGAYHNQFWIRDVEKRAFMARGVFGQLIYVDPDNELVVVKLSSWPEFVSLPRRAVTRDAIDAIANHLKGL